MFWDFSVGRSMVMLARTWPFLVLRFTVYLGVLIAYLAATGGGATFGWGLGSLGDGDTRAAGAFYGGLAGFASISIALYWFREYFLYLVKAGHIAVFVRLLDGAGLPEGESQIGHAQRVVRERFLEASVLFGVDQVVKGVIAAITGMAGFLGMLLPIPGIQGLVGFLRAIANIAVGLIDEMVLAYAIRTRSANPWDSARTATVLYAQNAAPVLRNAVWLVLIGWLLTGAVFLLGLAPMMALAALMPGQWTGIGAVFALIGAVCLRLALWEPFAVASLMQVYFKVIEGQSPDPDWSARLDAVSARFRDLGRRAAGASGWEQRGASDVS